MVELFGANEFVTRACLVGGHHGQRMAALPAVYAVRTLLEADSAPRGATTAYELVGAAELLDLLVSDGFELILD